MPSVSRRFLTPPVSCNGLSRLRSRVRAPSAPPLSSEECVADCGALFFESLSADPVDVSAMADANDEDQQPRVFDAVDDPPLSDSNPHRSASLTQCFHPLGTRVHGKGEDSLVQPAPVWRVQSGQLPLGRWKNDDLLGQSSPSRWRASS